MKLDTPYLPCFKANCKPTRKGGTIQTFLEIYFGISEFIRYFSVDIVLFLFCFYFQKESRKRKDEARAPKGKIGNAYQRRKYNRAEPEIPNMKLLVMLSHVSLG